MLNRQSSLALNTAPRWREICKQSKSIGNISLQQHSIALSLVSLLLNFNVNYFACVGACSLLQRLTFIFFLLSLSFFLSNSLRSARDSFHFHSTGYCSSLPFCLYPLFAFTVQEPSLSFSLLLCNIFLFHLHLWSLSKLKLWQFAEIKHTHTVIEI